MSHQAAQLVVEKLKAVHVGADVVVRDLTANPPPHIGSTFIGAIHSKPEDLTTEQASAVAYSEVLINEVLGADVIVLTAPVYNFHIPSTLKSWIDHITRAGRTFSYTAAGPQGLVTGKKAILVIASGGVYSEGPAKSFDFLEPYRRGILGFIGITDVEVVRAEGVAVGEIGPDKALARAASKAAEILAPSPLDDPHSPRNGGGAGFSFRVHDDNFLGRK